jgi:hypothetical protein
MTGIGLGVQAVDTQADVCIELFEHGDASSSGLYSLEPVHAALGPLTQNALSYFQVSTDRACMLP